MNGLLIYMDKSYRHHAEWKKLDTKLFILCMFHWYKDLKQSNLIYGDWIRSVVAWYRGESEYWLQRGDRCSLSWLGRWLFGTSICQNLFIKQYTLNSILLGVHYSSEKLKMSGERSLLSVFPQLICDIINLGGLNQNFLNSLDETKLENTRMHHT